MNSTKLYEMQKFKYVHLHKNNCDTMTIFNKKEDLRNLIENKKENAVMIETAEKMLDEIRYELERESKEEARPGPDEFEVKAIARKARWILPEFKDEITSGEQAGRSDAKEQILNAINKHPKDFIIDLSRNKPNSSYSLLKDVYKDIQKLKQTRENLSDMIYKRDRREEDPYRVADYQSGVSDLINNIIKQEQDIVDKMEQAIHNGDIEKVMAWMTRTKLLNEYVLEPAIKKGRIDSAVAKEILENAFNSF